jgi:alkylhydroperoxidase/carboxymuconolactone decarboxylase family protein YurZ
MQGQGTGEKQMTAQSEFTRPAHEYLFANCFEGIWGREGLEKRYRSLTVIS